MGRRVTVVLITWNSAPYLRRCLDGIARQTHPDIELINVDNASADHSAQRVLEAFPHCRQIINSTNRGFAAAANQAIRTASGDFVALCNPDAFLTAEYLSRIVAAFDQGGENFGAATGKLMRARGEDIEPTDAIDSMGIRMTRSGRHLDMTDVGRASARPVGLKPDLHEVFGVSGAAAVYRKSCIIDVTINNEYFDEDFFAYREDADVAWRARLFGWRAM